MELKGFESTLRQVGGSKMIVVPDWMIKAHKLEEGTTYRFFVEVL